MRQNLWNEAAAEMAKDDDPRWRAVGSWLRAEAWCMEAMTPMVELLNTTMEQKTGVKSYLRLGRTPDGDIQFLNDTNEGATAVAQAYLATTTPAPTAAAEGPAMTDCIAEIRGVLRRHLPRDRYDDDSERVGTYCTCGGWEGDYFADGEAGPFDDHLAAMINAELIWILARLDETESMLERTERQIHEPGGFIDQTVDADETIGNLRRQVVAMEGRSAQATTDALEGVSGAAGSPVSDAGGSDVESDEDEDARAAGRRTARRITEGEGRR